METTQHEVVVFGATSFVGRLTCAYLADRYGDDLDWAMAGRSQSRLESVRDEVGAGDDVPLIVADAADPAALEALCERARVVVSTVGPYALYGETLVRICAETGTDYCDLTGEVQWIRRMIERYEATAAESGARIVHCCGFDSLPSDLGVHYLQRTARQRFGAPCTRVKMRVKAMRGTFSGGTVASLVNVAREMRADPDLRRALADPYALCPATYRPATRQPDVKGPTFDTDAGAWVAPFVMAAINTRVVQRSNALSKQAYGADFRYDEAQMMGRGARGRLRAYALTAALGGFMAGVALAPTRRLLERFVLPGPGEGPSSQAQENGFYDIRFFGETEAGEKLAIKVVGDRDPGYGSTSKMLGEAAVCLARDIDTATAGGFWTPATIFGDTLVERLENDAGLHFEALT
ncbi:saccharopine dehydrogenase [Salinisphaera orenii MK-B5]|uniref:Saccharopine dehydrogenase n=1 Tax=Salinisphaera orenii MK-B5 TaxID=856730 RepID=A0A423PF64_9GAMM|nr:saccharopine dehydrogenase NADP-binding domain-containing protein [Salinisphaera orenii]ROO24271.1 saccharopine dehydrogenase [Salinisphaera orenii MK-B5]